MWRVIAWFLCFSWAFLPPSLIYFVCAMKSDRCQSQVLKCQFAWLHDATFMTNNFSAFDLVIRCFCFLPWSEEYTVWYFDAYICTLLKELWYSSKLDRIYIVFAWYRFKRVFSTYILIYTLSFTFPCEVSLG